MNSQQTIPSQPLMSIQQVAVLLNLSRRTIYRLVETGKLKAWHPSRKILRFRQSDVAELLSQGEESNPEQLSDYIKKNITP